MFLQYIVFIPEPIEFVAVTIQLAYRSIGHVTLTHTYGQSNYNLCFRQRHYRRHVGGQHFHTQKWVLECCQYGRDKCRKLSSVHCHRYSFVDMTLHVTEHNAIIHEEHNIQTTILLKRVKLYDTLKSFVSVQVQSPLRMLYLLNLSATPLTSSLSKGRQLKTCLNWWPPSGRLRRLSCTEDFSKFLVSLSTCWIAIEKECISSIDYSLELLHGSMDQFIYSFSLVNEDVRISYIPSTHSVIVEEYFSIESV